MKPKLSMTYAKHLGLLACLGLALMPAHAKENTPEQTTSKADLPRKIYAHYMGCFPAGTGPTFHHQFEDKSETEGFRHDGKNQHALKGGRFKTWPLVPDLSQPLTSQESADVEIRRALRAGIDGFAIDTWAGGNSAKETLNALFKAAEAGKYPFEVTICIDPWSMEGGIRLEAYKEAVNFLLTHHGKSPNLARRQGKPLILTYQGQGILAGGNAPSLGTQEGWDALIEAYKEVEQAAGQPLYFYFDFSEIFQGQQVKGNPTAIALLAAPRLASYFGAVGNFLDLNSLTRDKDFMQKMSETVRAAGAEWAPPVWYQYHNIGWHTEGVQATSKLRETWERAIAQGATLIQFATWNDYGEHTSLAPTRANNYGIDVLNRYYSDWWKGGKQPKLTEDQICITHTVAVPAKAYPFPGGGQAKTIEVITLLTSPGKIKVGKEEKDVDAGMTVSQFPIHLGQLQVELLRDGEVVQVVKSREHVTEKPFRGDSIWYSASSSDEKFWEEDFPGVPYPADDFYGDADNDGLPNWFEMYWFGKWRDFSTATDADPNADPDGDGKTNLQEYLERTDPTQKAASYDPGFAWDMNEVLERKVNFNPQKDANGAEVWTYLWQEAVPGEEMSADVPLKQMNYPHPGKTGYLGDGRSHVEITWNKRQRDDRWVLFLKAWNYKPGSHPSYGAARVTLRWTSPVDGTVDISFKGTDMTPNEPPTVFSVEDNTHEVLWSGDFDATNSAESIVLPDIKVKRGSHLYFTGEGDKPVSLEELRVILKK